MTVPALLPRDDDGEIVFDGSFPYFVTTQQAFERWQMCMNVATKFSGAPADSGEALAFAESLYFSNIPTDAPTDVAEAAEDPEFERMHPRGRVGRFVRNGLRIEIRHDTPMGQKSPGTTLEQIEKLGLNDWPAPSPAALKLLDGYDNTAAFHRLKRGEGSPGVDAHPPYKKKRRLRHDKIVGARLAVPVGNLLGADHDITVKLSKGGRLSAEEKDVVRAAADRARQGGAPDALFMAGGPASGKTTTLEQNPSLTPPYSVHVDPDSIKDDLPEYQALKADGDHYAASAVHLESGDIAARLAHEATDLRLNAVIDGTGDDEPGMFIKQLERKRDAGYDVSVLYANTPTDEAIRRAVKRAEEQGRFVPIPRVREQHAKVSRNFGDVSGLDWLAGLDVFDDNGHIGARDDDGTFHDLEPARMESFRAKKDEKWERRRDG